MAEKEKELKWTRHLYLATWRENACCQLTHSLPHLLPTVIWRLLRRDSQGSASKARDTGSWCRGAGILRDWAYREASR